jgi:hypothetical protein
MDRMLADYKKLKEEDDTLNADIKELANALDYHTVDNKNKRKALQERRGQIGPQMEALLRSYQIRQNIMQELFNKSAMHLRLAERAETWEWRRAT